MEKFDQTDIRHSEKAARNWDVTSVLSFAAAAAVGLVKTANDIRHQFFQSHIKGYDNERTIFADTLETASKQFATTKREFQSDSISAEKFNAEMHRIGEERHTAINGLLKKRYHISTGSAVEDWTVGTWQRATFLGRTDRVNAAMGFCGTALIALGAIAVLKHSSRVLDAINQKIDQQENAKRDR